MKSTRLKICLLLPIIVGVSACESWLDETPKSALVQNSFYKNADHAQAAVNAVYAFVTSPYGGVGTFGETPFALMEMSTGHFFTKVGQAQYAIEAGALNVNPESPYVLSWWQSSYQGIEAANLAIDNIPSIPMDEVEKKQLLGEAYFLRAHYYFNLVRMFGEIPVKITSTKSPSDGQVEKSSIQEVYETVIVPDLIQAEASGLPNTATDGRTSLGAVKSLLARVYLTMAGAPLNQTNKFALARDKAKEVIDAGWYSLFQSDGTTTWFDKINSVSSDNTGEHIFMANFGAGILDAYVPAYLTPVEVDITPFVEFGGLYPHESLLESYDPTDLRVQDHGFYFESLDVNGTAFTFPWAIYKHFDSNLVQSSPQSGKNFPILRYADVLLMYAEAQNKADGTPNADAYNAINGIRNRAGLADLSALSSEDFTEAVWRERVWELSSENGVWFDMLRTRKGFNTTSGEFVDLVGYTSPASGATFAAKNYFFPIPNREIQASSLEQNTGY